MNKNGIKIYFSFYLIFSDCLENKIYIDINADILKYNSK